MGETVDYKEDAFVNCIIGEGTTLRGEFDLNGLLRIDGTFYGKVRTSGKVLIGKNGRAECEIVAGTVVIGGKVKGEIIATERITLLSTGILVGNIVTPRLIIEEGVVFDGRCEIVEDKNKLEKIKQEYLLTRSEENHEPAKRAGGNSVLHESESSDQGQTHERFTPRVEQKVT